MLPEFDDAPTVVMPRRFASSIQLRPHAPARPTDERGRFLATLDGALQRLDERLAELVLGETSRPRDVSALAALSAVERRVNDALYLRDVLDDVRAPLVRAAVLPLIRSGAPLGPFLEGICLWADGVLDALMLVRNEIGALSPDWTGLRARLEAAHQFFFTGLVPRVRREVAKVHDPRGDVGALSAALDELVFAATLLERGLEQPFG